MRGIFLAAILGIVGVALGQVTPSPPKTIPKQDVLKTYPIYTFTPPQTYSTIVIMDSNGECTWSGFEYDPKTKMCKLTITFSVPGPLICTPLSFNESGEPTMTCTYKASGHKETAK